MIGRHVNPGIFVAFLTIAVATILQEGLVTRLDIGPVHPDIVLMITLNWTLLRGVEEGMLWGFTGGCMVDMFSGLPFGTSATAYVAIAGLVGLSHRALMRAHVLLPIFAGFAATIVYYGVAIVIVSSAQQQFLLSWQTTRVALGVAAFNAVLNPFLYWGAENFAGRLHPVPRTSW